MQWASTLHGAPTEVGENRIKYHIVGRTDRLLMHCIIAHRVNNGSIIGYRTSKKLESAKAQHKKYKEI
jgi:hypothetical protein